MSSNYNAGIAILSILLIATLVTLAAVLLYRYIKTDKLITRITDQITDETLNRSNNNWRNEMSVNSNLQESTARLKENANTFHKLTTQLKEKFA